MAIFVAYFDAAGNSEDKATCVLSVAGWIATEIRWRRLARDWKSICAREGVSGLHMKEFAHSLGEFSGWKGDEPRRQKFLADLAKVILRYTNREFSESLFLEGYRAVNEQYEFNERVGHPYMIAAWLCISKVRDWMAKKYPRDDVLFVFEKGDAHQQELRHLLERDRIDVDPIFLNKRALDSSAVETVPELECADFFAYEQHKNLTDIYLGRRTKGRTSLWALATRGQYFDQPSRRWSVHDGQFFEAAAKTFRVPRRVGVPSSPIPRELQKIAALLGDNFHTI